MKNRVFCLIMLGFLMFPFPGCRPKEKSRGIPSASEKKAPEEKLTLDETMFLYVPAGGKIEGHESLLQFLPKNGNEEKIKAALTRIIIGDENFTSPFPPGNEILDVLISKDKVAYINLNRDIAAKIQPGITTEFEYINSIVLTVLKNFPDIDGVMILIDGKENKTFAGHIDISKPFYLSLPAESSSASGE